MRRCAGAHDSVLSAYLDNAHLCVVTTAEAIAEDARVATLAVGIALGRLLEERMHELLVVNVSEGLAAGVQGALLGEGDHVVGGLAQRLCLVQRRLDAPVTDELRRQRTQKRLALICGPAELLELITVADHLHVGDAAAA